MSEEANRADLSAEAQPVLRSPKGEAGRAKVDVPSPDRLRTLWRRIKEHRIAQWTVGYVAVAYGIQHAVILTSESFEWPNIVARVSMLLLALGLPIAMTLAWYHGERTARRISSGELAVVSVVLLGITFAFYLFVRPAGDIAPAAQQASLGPAAVNGTSLAVLPFANVSGDANQEFFSDGMTDEIMTALAKVPALRVVGRESAFQFKGKNQDNRAIGRALGARYLVEGSVRKAGDRVRITAQLVRADDGVSLWTEGYDRDLKDVFAVQEDVSQAIAASLRVPLGLKPGENLVNSRNIDAESYQQYLRARALLRVRSSGEAVSLLEPLVARNPNYAPVWALLARNYGFALTYNRAAIGPSVEEQRRALQSLRDKQEMAAREAIRLDPKFAGGYSVLATIRHVQGKPLEAESLYRQALALDPGDPEVLDGYSQWLGQVGRIKAALQVREQLRILEPFVPAYNAITAGYLEIAGQNDAAIPILAAISPSSPEIGLLRNVYLAHAYAVNGRYNDAADMLLAIPGGQNRVPRQSVEEAARLLRNAATKKNAANRLPVLTDLMIFAYGYTDAPDRILDYAEYVETLRNYSLPGVPLELWDVRNGPVRKSERFKALVRRNGLVDFWRASGWPDSCHPTTGPSPAEAQGAKAGDDFECN